MGKASKWFRALLGLKNLDSSSKQEQSTSTVTRTKEKRRWSFVKSYREKDQTLHLQNQRGPATGHTASVSSQLEKDPNRHAIAVAAAKADVAEKAVAAANAAAEAVRLMNSGRCAVNPVTAYGSRGWREDFAAVKIQSAFRGYLARRALRALKAVVRLQALVRGHIRRKRLAEEAQWMQSIMRVQARTCAGRAQISESSHSSSKSSYLHHHPGPPTPEKFEPAIFGRCGKHEQSSILKRTGSKFIGREIGSGEKTHASFNWSERLIEKTWGQTVPSRRTGKSDKILEVDTVKPHFTPKQRRNLFHSNIHGLASDQYSHSFTTSKDSHQSVPSPSSGEVQSVTPSKFAREDEAETSPQHFSASSRGVSGRNPFTPSKSDGAASFLSGYSDYYPNYMSYTESSKAKVRSLSAPKQRPQYERSTSGKRYSMNGLGEPRSSSAQRGSILRASFTSKAYPGSGRLDRLGMPIGQRY